MSKRGWLALLLACVLTMSGCGMRTRLVPGGGSGENGSAAVPGPDAIAADGTDGEMIETAELPPEAASGEPDPDAPTIHDPTAERREFAEDADARMSADAANTVDQPGSDDQPGLPVATDAPPEAAREQSDAVLTVTEVRPLEEAEELGIGEDARAADTVMQYYQTLLASRTGSLFECQRLYVYWETAEDHLTVHKTSAAHTVILLSGGYDVSAKRPEDALLVDAGWVVRKNPGCIVKCVAPEMLERGAAVIAGLRGRDEWTSIDAVKHGRVLLLSEALMDSAAGQTAAAVYMACAMYPGLFADVDADQAANELLGEAAGAEMSGSYGYLE